jgi:C4-dicarboxylate-specific signal transduction histidine kinase
MGKFSRMNRTDERRAENVADLIEEVLALAGPKARKNRVSLEFCNETKAQIWCNPVEMGQVLVNLINNAIDAVKDREEKWVRVHALDHQGHVFVRVIDSGQGISAAVEKKIFEPFFTTKDVGYGTGLGLSISRGIVVDHGASLVINRDLPNTCFEVSFPEWPKSAGVVH